MTVLLVRHPVECSRFLRAGLSVAMQRAFATTAVTRPSLSQRGVHTIETFAQQFRVRQFGSYFTLYMVSWKIS